MYQNAELFSLVKLVISQGLQMRLDRNLCFTIIQKARLTQTIISLKFCATERERIFQIYFSCFLFDTRPKNTFPRVNRINYTVVTTFSVKCRAMKLCVAIKLQIRVRTPQSRKVLLKFKKNPSNLPNPPIFSKK